MVFRGSWQSLFFNLHDTPYLQNFGSLAKVLNLHDIYRILGSLPFSIHMIFAGSWQSPFSDLHDIYRMLAVSRFSIYMIFTGSWQSLFFDLPDIYMLSARLFFEFTGSFLTFTCFS